MNCDKKCDNELQFTIQENTLGFKLNETIAGGGSGSYRPLTEKPQINNRILQAGNNTIDYLGLQEEINDITEQDLDKILYGG